MNNEQYYTMLKTQELWGIFAAEPGKEQFILKGYCLPSIFPKTDGLHPAVVQMIADANLGYSVRTQNKGD